MLHFNIGYVRYRKRNPTPNEINVAPMSFTILNHTYLKINVNSREKLSKLNGQIISISIRSR